MTFPDLLDDENGEVEQLTSQNQSHVTQEHTKMTLAVSEWYNDRDSLTS